MNWKLEFVCLTFDGVVVGRLFLVLHNEFGQVLWEENAIYLNACILLLIIFRLLFHYQVVILKSLSVCVRLLSVRSNPRASNASPSSRRALSLPPRSVYLPQFKKMSSLDELLIPLID